MNLKVKNNRWVSQLWGWGLVRVGVLQVGEGVVVKMKVDWWFKWEGGSSGSQLEGDVVAQGWGAGKGENVGVEGCKRAKGQMLSRRG